MATTPQKKKQKINEKGSSARKILLALGGFVIDWPECEKYPQQLLYQNSVHAYDIEGNGTWTELPPMPGPPLTNHVAATFLDGCVFITGSWNQEEERRMYRFTIATQQWESLNAEMTLQNNERLQTALLLGPPDKLHSSYRYDVSQAIRIGDKSYVASEGWRHPFKLDTYDVVTQKWLPTQTPTVL